MSKETSFYLDFSDFDKGFERIVEKAIPDDAKKGLADGMNQVLTDSIELPPQAPRDIGDLHASSAGTVKVETKRGLLTASGGFKSEYARRQHEVAPGTFNYTISAKVQHPGPKFLQSKLAAYGKKYMGIVADAIRKRRRGI